MKKNLLALIIIGMLISISGISPASGAEMSNTYRLSKKEGCFTVKGSLNQFLNEDGHLAGTISGDLEGTVLTNAGPIEIHGIVMFRDVIQYWEITGGTVSELVGRTLVFDSQFRGIFNDYPMVKVNTTGTLIEGAEMGNVTLHGWTSLGEVIENYLEYHAVICP